MSLAQYRDLAPEDRAVRVPHGTLEATKPGLVINGEALVFYDAPNSHVVALMSAFTLEAFIDSRKLIVKAHYHAARGLAGTRLHLIGGMLGNAKVSICLRKVLERTRERAI